MFILFLLGLGAFFAADELPDSGNDTAYGYNEDCA